QHHVHVRAGRHLPEAVEVDELVARQPVRVLDRQILHLGEHRQPPTHREDGEQREDAGELWQRAHGFSFAGRWSHTPSGPRSASTTTSRTWKWLTATAVASTSSRSVAPASCLRPSCTVTTPSSATAAAPAPSSTRATPGRVPCTP